MVDILSDHALTILTAVGTLLAAFAGCVGALAARDSARSSGRSSRHASNAAQAALYVTLQQQYANDQMLEDLRELRSWFLWCKERGLDVGGEWKKQWESDPKKDPDAHAKARAVDKSRRRVSHFFGAIAELYSLGLLSNAPARRLASYSGVDLLLFEVVEPLEQQLNPDYDKLQFDILRKLIAKVDEPAFWFQSADTK